MCRRMERKHVPISKYFHYKKWLCCVLEGDRGNERDGLWVKQVTELKRLQCDKIKYIDKWST